MTTTTSIDAVSVTATQAGPRPIEGGWVRPAWATGHMIDAVPGNGNTPVHLLWNRDASIVFAAKDSRTGEDGEPGAPSLNRSDDVSFDLEDGAMTTTIGEVIVYVHDDLEVSPAEARKLAAALIQLADIAEGATS